VQMHDVLINLPQFHDDDEELYYDQAALHRQST